MKFQDETILFQPATRKQRSAKHLGPRDDGLQNYSCSHLEFRFGQTLSIIHHKKEKKKNKMKNNETPQNKLKEYFCYLIRRIKVRKYKKNGTCNFNSAYQMQNKGSYFSHQIASGLAVEFLNLHLTTSLYLPASLSLAAPISQQSGACARLMPICSASFAGLANLTHLAFRMDAFTRLKKIIYICSKIYYCKNIL